MRVMHSHNLYPAGIGVELHNQDDGQYVKAEIVEDNAKRLVKKKVLRAFSVGINRPRIIRDKAARGGRVVDGIFSEVSLVDRPANSNCKLSICKRLALDPNDTPEEITIEFLNKLEASADLLSDLSNIAPDDDSHELPDTTSGIEIEKRDYKNDPKDDTDMDNVSTRDHGDGKEDLEEAELDKKDKKDDMDDKDGKDDGDDKDDDGLKDHPDDCDCSKCTSETPELVKDNNASARSVRPDANPSTPDSSTSVNDVSEDSTNCPSPEVGDEVDPGQVIVDVDKAMIPTKVKSTRRGTVVENPSNTEDLIDAPETEPETPDITKAEEAAKKWSEEIATARLPELLKDAGVEVSETPEETVEKRDFDSGVGGGVDRDKLPESDFAGPNRTYPIVTPGDVQDAVSLVGKHPEVKSKIIALAYRKGPEFVAKLPDDWKHDQKKDASTYLMKRFHDVFCPAYSWDSIVDAYPALEKSNILDQIPLAKSVIYKLLEDEVLGDNGSGEFSTSLNHLSATYKELSTFPLDTDPIVLSDARAELFKSFMLENGDCGPEPPSPKSQPKPGSYKRPYVSAGHAKPTASANQKPRWPSKDNQPDPADYDRGLITAGHEADSPANKGLVPEVGNVEPVITELNPDTEKAVNDNSIRIRYAMMNALNDVHDHFTSMDATYCCLTPSDAGTPVTAYRGSQKDVSSGEITSAQSRLDLSQVPDLVKLAAAEIAHDQTATYQAEITQLKSYIEELENMADPSKAPFLGVGSASQLISKRQQPSEKDQAPGWDEDEVKWCLKHRNSGNADLRERCEKKLAKLSDQYPDLRKFL